MFQLAYLYKQKTIKKKIQITLLMEKNDQKKKDIIYNLYFKNYSRIFSA